MVASWVRVCMQLLIWLLEKFSMLILIKTQLQKITHIFFSLWVTSTASDNNLNTLLGTLTSSFLSKHAYIIRIRNSSILFLNIFSISIEI